MECNCSVILNAWSPALSGVGAPTSITHGIDRSGDWLGTRQDTGRKVAFLWETAESFQEAAWIYTIFNNIVVRIMKTGEICELSWNMFNIVTLYNSINECHTTFRCTRHTRVVTICIKVKYLRWEARVGMDDYDTKRTSSYHGVISL